MIHPKCIIPECNADTFFVEILKELRDKDPNHKHCKTKVLKALDELNVPKSVGIIDKDPGAKVKTDLSDYDLIRDDGQDGFLSLFKHKNKNCFIIEINKEFEDWLFRKVIPQSGINPADYGIPIEGKEFNEYFKYDDIRNRGMVRQFFKKLKGSNSQSLQTFLSWLNECTE
jgi:hypothetical protein